MAERIAYLISQYPTLSHSFIFREIRELRALGIEIDPISIRRPDRPFAQLSQEEQTEARVTFYVRSASASWPVVHARVFFARPFAYLRGFALAIRTAHGRIPELLRHLRFFAEAVVAGDCVSRRGIRHVHTHFASAAAMLLEAVFGIPVTMTIHGSDEFIDPAGFCMTEKLRAATRVFAISRYGASQIMRFSNPADWDKVAVVRLGINPDDFIPAPRVPKPGPFQVICVGRLVPVKAYRFLIRACALLLARGRPITLTIIGGGPEQDALMAFVRDLGIAGQVEFTGPLPNEQVRERVRQADCFALASFAEGVPVVLMEAMALQVPCVATRVTGVPELIADGVEGLLMPPADPEALADAIDRLMQDEPMRASLAAAGRRKVLAEYDLRANARELRDLLAPVSLA